MSNLLDFNHLSIQEKQKIVNILIEDIKKNEERKQFEKERDGYYSWLDMFSRNRDYIYEKE